MMFLVVHPDCQNAEKPQTTQLLLILQGNDDGHLRSSHRFDG